MFDILDYCSVLSQSQLRVVKHKNGPALVIAGPGSGKTHVMVYRVAYLIENGVFPEQILLLTFTKKAAKEMLGRVQKLIGNAAQKVQGGTFHGFAARTLFKHYETLGYSAQFTILGQGDAVELVRQIYQEVKSRVRKGDKFPKSDKLQGMFSRAVNKQVTLEEEMQRSSIDCSGYQDLIKEIFRHYKEEKRRMNLLDYDDLLVEFRRLLQIKNIRKIYSNKYRYIIIDEFQDSNIIQSDIAIALAEHHQNLVIVGDDCQSVYGFRGANIQNILTFVDKFPEAKIFRLTENFRSYPPIVEIANALIDKAEDKLDKVLTAVSTEMDIKPYVKSCNTQKNQAAWVSQQILAFHTSGIPYNEIAVLYRNGYHANLLDMFLTSIGIPYVKIGGVKLMESAHVKDILSFLRVCANPLDKISWKRVLMLLPGIGQKTAEKTLVEMTTNIHKDNDIAEILSTIGGKQKYKESLHELGRFLVTLNLKLEVRLLLDNVWEYYLPIFEEKFDDGEFEYRKFGIDHLLEFSENYADLGAFLAEFLLSEEQEKNNKKEDILTLSTIHSAKGLEWTVVIITECIEGAIPSYRAEDEQEELRLFYVAITRAKKHLIITYPKNIKKGEKTELARPSRFLTGLPYVGVDSK